MFPLFAACETRRIAAIARPTGQAANEAQVRALWAAYQRGGVAAMRTAVGPDVEWLPWTAGGEVLHGTDALSEWAGGGPDGPEVAATVHAFECHGDCVLATGSLRVFREGGFLDLQPSWVYFFRDGALRRAAAFATREDALAAIAAY